MRLNVTVSWTSCEIIHRSIQNRQCDRDTPEMQAKNAADHSCDIYAVCVAGNATRNTRLSPRRLRAVDASARGGMGRHVYIEQNAHDVRSIHRLPGGTHPILLRVHETPLHRCTAKLTTLAGQRERKLAATTVQDKRILLAHETTQRAL